MGQAADELSATQVSPYDAAAGPAPSAHQLRAQIDRQRSELGRDLEVLGDRVSPSRMVQRRRASIRQSARGVKERLLGARDDATARLGDSAGSMGASMGAVGERVAVAPHAAVQTAQGAPLAVGLVAFGAGAALAALLPTSERERRMAEQAAPTLERAAEEAGSIARHGAEELRPVAEEAADHLRSTAQDAAEALKEQATTATEEVRVGAQGAADEVKGAATSA